MNRMAVVETQEVLLERACKGDSSAFWEVLQPHEQMIFAVALGVMRDPERAQDVQHDVYVRAFSTIGNLRSPSKLAGWLYTMTRNIAHEHTRKTIRQEKNAKSIPSPAVISVPDMMIHEEQLDLMGRELAELPETHRVVLGMKYLNSMSCREIADTLGIGLEAAKSRLFEARKALRIRMEAANRQKAATPDPTSARGGVQSRSDDNQNKKAVEK